MAEQEFDVKPWEPGTRGKGVVMSDGRVAVWKVNPLGGDPHHAPALERLGWPFDDVAWFLFVDSDGEVQTQPSGNALRPSSDDPFAAIQAHDNRLRRAIDQGWRFT